MHECVLLRLWDTLRWDNVSRLSVQHVTVTHGGLYGLHGRLRQTETTGPGKKARGLRCTPLLTPWGCWAESGGNRLPHGG